MLVPLSLRERVGVREVNPGSDVWSRPHPRPLPGGEGTIGAFLHLAPLPIKGERKDTSFTALLPQAPPMASNSQKREVSLGPA